MTATRLTPTAYRLEENGSVVTVTTGQEGRYTVHDPFLNLMSAHASTFDEATVLAEDMLDTLVEINRAHRHVDGLRTNWNRRVEIAPPPKEAVSA